LALFVVECLLWLSERFGAGWHKGYAVLTAVAMLAAAMMLMAVWWAVAVVIRRQFQFGIRSLLVLTVAVAVPTSWFAVRMREARRQQKAADAIVRSGSAVVVYDWEVDSNFDPLPTPRPSGQDLPRFLLGSDFFDDVCAVYFTASKVINPGLENLRDLTKLKVLYFLRTTVTDAGLEDIGCLTQLDTLILYAIPITDEGLKNLNNLTQLRNLEVYDTGVTYAGVKKLQQALPNCKVEWRPRTP
jgi:hypothetical protein